MNIASIVGCVALAAAACASGSSAERGGPRGLHANEHLREADRHDDAAHAKTTWPETTRMEPGGPTPVTMPWYRTWDSSADHERLARDHRNQAAAIQAAFDEACRDVPLERVRASPIAMFGLGAWPTTTGAVVYLDKQAGTADALLAHLRCHRAWMMLAPARDMDRCPLDLRGLVADARGDDNGITLVLSVDDRDLVRELQQRVQEQLESRPTKR